MYLTIPTGWFTTNKNLNFRSPEFDRGNNYASPVDLNGYVGYDWRVTGFCGRTISPVYENDGSLPYFVWKNGNVSYDSWNTDDKSGSYGSKIYTNLDWNNFSRLYLSPTNSSVTAKLIIGGFALRTVIMTSMRALFLRMVTPTTTAIGMSRIPSGGVLLFHSSLYELNTEYDIICHILFDFYSLL